MSAITDVQHRALSSWAARNPRVLRVVLFGSRVKGTHRLDSDLDIAVELEPGEDSDAILATWIHHCDDWKTEMSSIVPFDVDLHWRDIFGTTGVVDQGINEASEVVYDRTG